jgi:hypothetical protein
VDDFLADRLQNRHRRRDSGIAAADQERELATRGLGPAPRHGSVEEIEPALVDGFGEFRNPRRTDGARLHKKGVSASRVQGSFAAQPHLARGRIIRQHGNYKLRTSCDFSWSGAKPRACGTDLVRLDGRAVVYPYRVSRLQQVQRHATAHCAQSKHRYDLTHQIAPFTCIRHRRIYQNIWSQPMAGSGYGI